MAITGQLRGVQSLQMQSVRRLGGSQKQGMWDIPDMVGNRPWELRRVVAGKGRASQCELPCCAHSNLSSSTWSAEAGGYAVHTSSRGVQPPVLALSSQSLHSSSHTIFNVWDGGYLPVPHSSKDTGKQLGPLE